MKKNRTYIAMYYDGRDDHEIYFTSCGRKGSKENTRDAEQAIKKYGGRYYRITSIFLSDCQY